MRRCGRLRLGSLAIVFYLLILLGLVLSRPGARNMLMRVWQASVQGFTSDLEAEPDEL